MSLTDKAALALVHPVKEPGPPPPLAESGDQEQVLSFGHYLALVRRHWWKITLAVLGSCGLAVLITSQVTPLYESTARIAIDMNTSSALLGAQASTGVSGSEADAVFNTALQILQSDAVLRPVAQRFHLRPSASGRNTPKGVTPSEAPVSLRGLTVVRPANSFLIDIIYRSADPRQAADVANAIAHSYITHGMEMRTRSSAEESVFMERQLADLKANMTDSAMALAGFEKELGVIDQDEKTSIIFARLVQLNTEYTEAENDRIRKETAYRALQDGSVAALEISPLGGDLAKLADALHLAKQRMETLKAIYGTNHLEYKRAANELNEVTRQYDEMKAEIGKRITVEYEQARSRERLLEITLRQSKSDVDTLNARSTEYKRLKREAEANQTLYNELYRKVKEAGINGSFQGSAIRIADEARPSVRPAYPNKPAFLVITFLFSLLLSLAVIVLADMSDKSLRNPEQARRVLGVEVIGTLPLVRGFEEIAPAAAVPARGSLGRGKGAALTKRQSNWFNSTSFYEESVRIILTLILIDHRERPLRSILVTSADPGEGKSSCVANMAKAFARQGGRALLIDADLRSPVQQNHFRVSEKVGLNDAIASGKRLADVRQRVDGYDKLDVVAGSSSIDLLGRVGPVVESLLQEAKSEYDIVFIDASPMWSFAETLQIACVVDGVLLVSHAGRTDQRAVASALATLRRLRVRTIGVVLNQVQHDKSSSNRAYQNSERYADQIA